MYFLTDFTFITFTYPIRTTQLHERGCYAHIRRFTFTLDLRPAFLPLAK
jgi:hypothetical protein